MTDASPALLLSRVGPASRREQLLTVAARLFALRGFAGVTMDEIGAAAGMSGPALYHHFAGKEAMLGEMLISISDHLHRQGAAISTLSASAQERIEALIRGHVAFAVQHPELITVHFRDLVHTSESDRHHVRVLQASYVQHWVDALQATDAGLDTAVLRPAVHAVLGLINSTPFSASADEVQTSEMLRSMATGALLALPTTAPATTPAAVRADKTTNGS